MKKKLFKIFHEIIYNFIYRISSFLFNLVKYLYSFSIHILVTHSGTRIEFRQLGVPCD